jgi:hypothetical protein
LAEEFGSVLFDDDLRLEIDAGGEAQKFMSGPGVTVSATVLTPPIWVDTGLKTNIRAVVVRDDCPGMITKEMRRRRRIVFRVPVRIPLPGDALEAIGRVEYRPTTARS